MSGHALWRRGVRACVTEEGRPGMRYGGRVSGHALRRRGVWACVTEEGCPGMRYEVLHGGGAIVLRSLLRGFFCRYQIGNIDYYASFGA